LKNNMTRRKFDIPIHIHEDEPKPFSQPESSKPKQTVSNEEFKDNVMQGLTEHHEETPRQPLEPKDKRNLILWFGVSIFTLIILIVWVLAFKMNLRGVSKELNSEQGTIESVSDQFIDDFQVLRNNLKGFEDVKADLEAEQLEQEAINDLKNKIEDETNPNHLPEIGN